MPRSLLPREHGAYVQLLAPLTAALIAFGVTLAGALLALGACLAFAANEPLLVILGHRGRRMREQDGARARRLLAVLAPAAVIAGVAGLALAPDRAQVMAAAVALPAGVLIVLAWQRAERSLAGELVAATALAGAAAPVAAAGGARWQDAMLLWAAWSVGYACTVVAVHRVIARHRKRATRIDHAIAAGVIALTLALAITAIDLAHARIAIPLAASSAVLLVVAPAATHLRAIGFALLGASLISLVLVVQTLS